MDVILQNDVPTRYAYRDAVVGDFSLAQAWDWIVGVFQGEFNDDPSVSQIIADGIIGSIPYFGEIPDARDVCAISLRWYREPAKMEEALEWVSLAGCVIGFVPGLGGTPKTVARFFRHYPEKFLERAAEIIAALNYLGVGNAERWVKNFKFSRYLPEVVKAFQETIDLLIRLFDRISRTTWAFSRETRIHAEHFMRFLMYLREKAADRMKEALGLMDEKLAGLQSHIDEAGSATSKQTEHTLTPQTQGKPTRTDEASTSREPPPDPKPKGKGHEPLKKEIREPWMAENAAMLKKDFPSLKEGTHVDLMLKNFSTAPNRGTLQAGEWRVYGKSQPNARLIAPAPDTRPGGSWFGTGPVPKNAEEWRKLSGVTDQFNADGKILTITHVEGEIPALKGGVAEQELGGKTGKQFLPGGGNQAYIDRALAEELDAKIAAKVGDPRAPGTFRGEVSLPNGSRVRFEIRDTNWENTNGKYGWGQELSFLFEYYSSPLAPTEPRPKHAGIA